MKKTLIAVAALAATSAFAQVTISGSMQVGIVNSGAAGANAAVTHLGNGTNAINMTAAQDIGGGLKAGWDSQIRFNAANGDRNSSGDGAALFHNLNVYLSSATLGTARIGKIAEVSNCAYDPWACGGGAAMAAGIGKSALLGAGAMANAVSYQTPTIAGFSAGVQRAMTPTAGTTGGRQNERSIANVSYVNGPLTAQYLRTSGNNLTLTDDSNIGPSAAAQAAAADSKVSAQSLAASYDFGVAKVNLVNVRAKNEVTNVTTASITSVSGTVPLGGAYTLLAGYLKDSKETNKERDTKASVGINYAMSKRTTLGADLFKAEQGALAGSGETGNAGTGFALRMRHTF